MLRLPLQRQHAILLGGTPTRAIALSRRMESEDMVT
jgi:hypothetical protein